MSASLLAIATTTLLLGVRWKSMHPLPESSGVGLDAKQHNPSTVDQPATQTNVAALADAVEFLLAPDGVLPRHHPNPGCEVPSATSRPINNAGRLGPGLAGPNSLKAAITRAGDARHSLSVKPRLE